MVSSGEGRRTQRSVEAQAWRPFYGTKAWKQRRALQLRQHPLCVTCLKHGRTTAATVADHVQPHKGDWELFIAGQIQSLCAPCHDAGKQREDRAGYSGECDATGWPTDERHPANRRA